MEKRAILSIRHPQRSHEGISIAAGELTNSRLVADSNQATSL
jgi:hypothetical protein